MLWWPLFYPQSVCQPCDPLCCQVPRLAGGARDWTIQSRVGTYILGMYIQELNWKDHMWDVWRTSQSSLQLDIWLMACICFKRVCLPSVSSICIVFVGYRPYQLHMSILLSLTDLLVILTNGQKKNSYSFAFVHFCKQIDKRTFLNES